MNAEELKPGQTVAGRYRIKRELGRGGMGHVLSAHDLQLGRAVAIKILLPGVATDTDAVPRFMREARAAVRLTSLHSVRVFDVGTLRDGAPFMVMELLSGRDLAAVLAETGRVPVEDAVEYVTQAMEGLAEAHVLGIVHRDIKPRNLFLTKGSDGKRLVKVLDFGLAKAPLANGEKGLTATHTVMGSPEYMSPEQMRGTRDVDARADIWALGVTLYELLTGTSPFSAPNQADLFVKVLQDAPTPPHRLFADIPFALSQTVLRCLEKDPAARWANVGELARAIDEYAPLSVRGVAAERVVSVLETTDAAKLLSSLPPPVVPGRQADTVAAATYESKIHVSARVRWFAVAAVVAIVGAVLGVAAAYSTRGAASADGSHFATSPSAAPEPASPPPPEVTATPLSALAEPSPSGTVPAQALSAPHVHPLAPRAYAPSPAKPERPERDAGPSARY